MPFNLEIFKRHPYATGIGAVVVFGIFYYLLTRNSGSGAGASSTAGGAQSSQDAQIAAAQNIAQIQSQTQLQAAQISAGVQTTAIGAQQDVTNNQTAASLAAIEAQTAAQTTIYSKQADTQQAEIGAITGVVKDQYDSQTAQHQATIDYLTNLSNVQGAVASQQIYTQGQIVGQEVQQQGQASMYALQHVKDVGGSQNRTAIILSAIGNPSGGNIAAAGQTVSSVSGDNLLGGIAKGAGSIVAGLFG